ncbi:MAG: putative bifunctional diguanylate cyclase/phosphodiesterase, partial [Pyrinomonadaceae bacterium]
VARLGGDEFVMVLLGRESSEITSRVMHRVTASLSQPYFIGGHELYITCSIGLSFYAQDEQGDADTLLKNADLAMYRAKSLGRNNIQLYASEMNVEMTSRVSLEAKLRQALQRQEFALHYQPQVDLRTGNICGMEALIRWQHPELGVIFPAQFIPVAESTGLIVPIGEWVLRLACTQNQSLQDGGLRGIPVSVNMSARQFKQMQMATLVAQILQETRLDPKYLELELTESVAMDNAKEVFATLRELRCMGIRISLDDFGTGYSSLSYLKRFPIDALKIDQAFINDITLDPHNVAIAEAIITLGHSLGLRVIAEGVATPEQALLLRKLGCEQAQGYVYSQPMPFEKMKQLLNENRPFRTAGIDTATSIKLVS